MELILIRHGLPERVETHDGTPADPPLAELGHRQAEAVADWLAAERIDDVVVSPMQRARQTASPLERSLGVTATVAEGVSEFDRDAASYIPMEELKATDYEAWKRFVDNQDMDDDPLRFQRVVVDTVEQVVADHPGQRVAIVCHGGVINAYAAHVLGMGSGNLMFFDPAYTSINRFLAAGSGERSLVSLNERAHLRGLPTTGRHDGV